MNCYSVAPGRPPTLLGLEPGSLPERVVIDVEDEGQKSNTPPSACTFETGLEVIPQSVAHVWK